ncbi:MAG: hypothetical protein IPK97_01445 [Ahniella sp.]|nr:hypothetical protein [Ahniella sp.]
MSVIQSKPAALRLLTSTLVIVLAGCAVLRVDVDVYKGPLADEEHVQMQRLAVMAAGAKPLLKELRDRVDSETSQGSGAPDMSGLLDEVLALYDNQPDGAYAQNVKEETENALAKIYEDLSAVDKGFEQVVKVDPSIFKNVEQADLGSSYPECGPVSSSKLLLEENGKRSSVNQSFCKFALISEATRQVRKPNTDATFKSAQAASSKAWGSTQSLYRQLLRTIAYSDRGDPENSLDGEALSRDQLRAIVALVVVMTDHNKLEFTKPLSDCAKWDSNAPVANAIGEWRGRLYESGTALAIALMCSPRLTSEWLLRTNEDLIRNSPENAEWKRSLVFYDSRTDSGPKLAKSARAFRKDFSAEFRMTGLRTERQGLETLISDYLCAHDDAPKEAGRCQPGWVRDVRNSGKLNDVERAKQLTYQALTESLIRFAQKMLFASNNMIFVRSECRGSSTSRDDHSGSDGPNSCGEIAGVLEVVGNSILVQANELHSRKEHGQAMMNRQQGRKLAIQSVFAGGDDSEFEQTMALIGQQRDFLKKMTKDSKSATSEKANLEKKLTSAKQEAKTIADRIVVEEANAAKYPALESPIQNALLAYQDPMFAKCLADERVKIVATTADTSENAEKIANALFDRASGCATREEQASAGIEARREMVPKFTALLAAIAAHSGPRKLTGFESDLKLKLATVKQARAGEEATLAKSKEALATAEKARDDTAKSLKEAADRLAAIPDEANYLGQVQDYGDGVLALLRSQGASALKMDSTIAFRDRWRNSITQWVGKGNAAQDDADRNSALRVLDMTARAPAMPPELLDGCSRTHAKPECGTDTTYAMDMLITWLQTNRTSLLKFYGKNSPQVRQIDAALDEAFLDRAGLTYIRPSSSYLRSSYASTDLQRSQSLSWDNMLNDMYERATPILGEAIERARPHQSLLDKIDKQYWQNINTVRVAGGGRTNYVLAKDDVGNWTARSFSSNYEKMLASMQGLALHHYGAELGASLATNDGTPRRESETRLTPQSSGLGGLFAEYRDDFEKGRVTANEKLKAALTSPSVEDRLKKVWNEHADIKDADKLADLKSKLGAHQSSALKGVTDSLADKKKLAEFGSDLRHHRCAPDVPGSHACGHRQGSGHGCKGIGECQDQGTRSSQAGCR